MIVKTVTYKDYDGNQRTEEFRFHFTQTELLEMESTTEGGFSARVNRIMSANSHGEMFAIMKNFILDAFGVKSDDGRRFRKNKDIREAFKESPAFDIIFREICTGENAAKASAEFINGVVPEGMPKPMAAN